MRMSTLFDRSFFLGLGFRRSNLKIYARVRSAPLRALALLTFWGAASLANAQTAQVLSGRVAIGSGFSEPFHMALDASGDLFVSDADNIAIYEIVAVNGTISTSPTIRLLYRPSANPEGIAVDAKGNVYFTTLDVYSNSGNNSVKNTESVKMVI